MNTESFDISTEIFEGDALLQSAKVHPFQKFLQIAEIKAGYDQTDVKLKKMQHTFRVY